jgi:thymidylate synthase
MIINQVDQQYLNLVKTVLREGELTKDRTGVGTISTLGFDSLKFDLREGFPILTTKKIPFRLVFEELKWFLSGSTNSKSLEDKNVNIWAEWGDPVSREHGPIYGKQWRDWSVVIGPFGSKWVQSQLSKSVIKNLSLNPFGYKAWANAYTYFTVESIEDDQLLVKHTDQIKYVIYSILSTPESRRILVNAWRVDELDKMSLTPCHNQMQFKVTNKFLDLKLYQRSADLGLGVPFNISSYALLLELVAAETKKIPRYFIHTFGDLHVYTNHKSQLEEQLERSQFSLPELFLVKPEGLEDVDISEYNYSDIKLNNYQCWPNVFKDGPMQVAV